MVIETGIPLPRRKHLHAPYQNLVRDMPVEGSVAFDNENCANHFAKLLRKAGFKATTRRMPDGWRVWRTE